MYDAIIIGGGPAGTTTAARLALAGRRVLLFEREQFPRFHIGESLLPCSVPLLNELGALEAVEAAGLRKYAAEFVVGDCSLTRRYPFADSLCDDPPYAFQVDRAAFDAILLKNAVRVGVEVREGSEVRDFTTDADGVGIVADGVTHRAQVLVDATGQRSLLAGQFRLRRMDPDLKNFAVFSHFEGARRGSGEAEGDIAVVLVPDGWWWVIPLPGDRTSVGLVAPARTLAGQKPDEQYFERALAACPYLAARFAGARRAAPVRTASDYSYVSDGLAGDRWLLVGDAAAFIDPVFSSGVHLALAGAFKAAVCIDAALERGRFVRSSYTAYERWVRQAIAMYSEFVKGFYRPGFVELMLNPTDVLQLRPAVISVLAGHGPGSFALSWRVRVFSALTQLNRRFEMVPPLPGRGARAALVER